MTHMVEGPMVYLSKNYVRILGVSGALEAAKRLPDREVVIQICGETGPIQQEAEQAVRAEAKVIFVDTGNQEDVRLVSGHLRQQGLRDRVQVAFAGGVTLTDLPHLATEDLDVVDMGRALIDAPLLDCRYKVLI